MKEQAPSVLLVDDHPLFREGLAGLIRKTEPGAQIHQAAELSQAEELLKKTTIDLAFIDISLKTENGLELVSLIHQDFPDTLPIVLSMHEEKQFVRQAYQRGAKGYILKDAPMELLEEIFQSLPNIDRFVTHPALMPREVAEADPSDPLMSAFATLTSREQDVFALLTRGMNYKEIAYQLGISAKTASVHRFHIQQKLGIYDQRGIIRAALALGVITPEEIIRDVEHPPA